MPYQGAGARTGAGQDFRTKKDLKAAIATKPAFVTIYVTDAFGPNAGKTLKADNLDDGVKYNVAGPNPYNNRKWYATVEKLPNGTVRVS